MSIPKGEITIQTLAMPADTNPNGDIFGGWLVSQMDLAAGVVAKKHSHSRVVTVAIDSMSFLKPVRVGDIISCYADIIKKGRTSMTIAVDVWAQAPTDSKTYKVTSGVFVFVAINDQGKPRPIDSNS